MAKLKRFSAPKFWKIKKKVSKWTVAPSPGPHKKFECIPLQILLRDILKVAETGKEAKTILNRGEIIVDGLARKDTSYPLGLMDTVAIPKMKKYFRVVPSEKGLMLVDIDEAEVGKKLFKIKNKTVVKKGKIQLNLHDGKNLLVGKDVYKTGDSLLLKMPEQKILEHIKMEKGSTGLITHGKNSGKLVKIKEVIVTRSREPNKVICELDNEEIEVIKEYVFVVGKKEPVLKLS
jgi:small subunit ribosomal protein S4e